MLLLAAAACVVLGVQTAYGVPSREADPKRMVLQLRDLPTGFGRTSAHYASNARAARESKGITLADYRRLGRITGYEAEFRREQIVGLIYVQSTASTYEDDDGARDSVRATQRVVAKTGKFTRLSVGAPLGHEARMYSTTVKQSGFSVIVYSLVWRYEEVKASLIADGLRGTVTPDSVVRLAQKQQRRIRAELH
jgi:hypothetical protein